MYRPQESQVRQSPEATPEATSASHQINFWRTQAAAASERERKALEQAAEYQRLLEVERKAHQELRKKVMNILN